MAWQRIGNILGPPGPLLDPLGVAEVRADIIRAANNTTGPTITSGTAAPTAAAPMGSIYLRTGAPTTAGQRLYWNQNGSSGGWVAIDNQPYTLPEPLSRAEVIATGRFRLNSTTGPTITSGAAAPTTAQPAGSLYINNLGSAAAGARLFWNTNGTAGGWIGLDNVPYTLPEPLTRAEFIATARFRTTSTSGPTITSGSAVPTAGEPVGSIYLRTGAPTLAGQRLYWRASTASWVAIDNQPQTVPDVRRGSSNYTTNASGVITISFSPAFASAPTLVANVSDNTSPTINVVNARVTAISTTSATLQIMGAWSGGIAAWANASVLVTWVAIA